MTTKFEVNGRQVSVDVEPRLTLADCLRHELRLTGTHIGCEHGVCGACTVIVDGEAVQACIMLAVRCEGRSIETIEGLAQRGRTSRLQQAFHEKLGTQCGFCTPGMIMTAAYLLEQVPNPSEHEIRHALEGNLCRCTGYVNIVESIRYAGELMGGSDASR